MTEVHGRKRIELTTATLVTIGVVLAVFALILMGTTKAARAGEAGPDATPTIGSSTDATSAPVIAPAEGSLSDIKNVVMILADDLDWPTFDEVPRLAALKKEGTTLSNFVVTNSLCCPSRTSFMRAQYVHNHRVISNIPATGGGWEKFQARGLEDDCLPTWLQKSDVETALIGKYLNGFPNNTPTPTYIPPGYDYFVTSTSKNQAYQGFDYTLNENGTLKDYGHKPADYMNAVLVRNAKNYLKTVKAPFFLEFSSYNPHTPAPFDAKYATAYSTGTVPRTPSFNSPGTNEVGWLASHDVLNSKRVNNLDRLWQNRLRSTESIADTYVALKAQLEATGHADDTLIIVTSDNGYHAGVHRLKTGKQTAFKEDSVVPAIFIGPGISKGAVISQVTSMVDLGPTISSVFGARTPSYVDGRDLSPLLRGEKDVSWRTATLTENLSRTLPGDPDYSPVTAPPFHALRSEHWLYIEYRNNDVELYDLKSDPFEMHNVQASTNPAIVAQLHAQLQAMIHCKAATCRIADAMPNGTSILPFPQVTGEPTPTPSVSATATPTPTTSATSLVQ
ncbi:MAG: sulfatase [Candidatus Nanopelagicales bacterium]|nr:sulfatase [Candidatus Nanopelagicales bacterium]